MQWVMKKRSYCEFGELLNPGVKTLIYATDPLGGLTVFEHGHGYIFTIRNMLHLTGSVNVTCMV